MNLGNPNTVIKNLINLDNIIEISINYYILFNRPKFIGCVYFKKNNTSLEQKFEGVSISDVYLQIFNFCNSL